MTVATFTDQFFENRKLKPIAPQFGAVQMFDHPCKWEYQITVERDLLRIPTHNGIESDDDIILLSSIWYKILIGNGWYPYNFKNTTHDLSVVDFYHWCMALRHQIAGSLVLIRASGPTSRVSSMMVADEADAIMVKLHILETGIIP